VVSLSLLVMSTSALGQNPDASEPVGTLDPTSASASASPTPPVAQVPSVDPPLPAEPPMGPPPGVEVMQVKGRAVSGIETDVPESVTQFDAETIAALGAGNIADLAKVTPNVEIRQAGATTATFFIRGVGLSDFSSNAAGAVGIFQDDVQLNAPAIQLGQLFDTETVDVKRGPQGYGLFRNASAGAIRIFANKPSGDYEARLRSSMGSFWTDDTRDAFIRDTEGALNIPLIEGALATRIAFRVRKTEPFFTNGCANAPPFDERLSFDPSGPPERSIEALSICGEQLEVGQVSRIPTGLDKHVGDRSDWALRGALRLQPPGSDADFILNIHGSRLAQDSTVGQAIGTELVRPDPAGGQVSRFGGTTNRNYWEPDQEKEFKEIEFRNAGVSSQAEFNALAEGELMRKATEDAFVELGKNLAEDRVLDRKPYRGDYNNPGRTTLDTKGGYLRGNFCVGEAFDVVLTAGTEHYERFRNSDIDFTPETSIHLLVTDSAEQYTFDAAVNGEAFDGAVRWNVGTSFLSERLDNRTYSDIGSTTLPDPISRTYEQSTSAYTATAHFTWDFLEDFTLNLGARWNYETKEFGIDELVFRQFDAISRHRQKTWQEPTGGIGLVYHITPTSQFYAKYTRGYKVGHFNSNNGTELDDPGPAEPEFLDSFEWGFKGSWLENRIRASGAFFFYKYQDYQVFIFRDNPRPTNPPSLVIRNAEDVQQYGLELDVFVYPLKDWTPEAIHDLELVVRFGWLESEFLEFTNKVFRQGTQDESFQVFPIVIDYGGNQLLSSPNFKVSGTVKWPLDLGDWGKLTPRYDFEWSDDIFFDPTEGKGSLDKFGVPIQPDYAVGQKAWWVHNVSLEYRTPVGNISVRGWVRNILDKRYKTYAFDASFFAQQMINFVADPRSVGADVTIKW